MEISTVKNIYAFIKKYSTFLKILVSVVILYFIFTKIDLRDTLRLFTQITDAKIWLLIVSVVVVKFFTQVLNWSYSLEIFKGETYPFRKVLKTHFIGLALRFFLPGGIATVGKMLYFDKDDRKRTFMSLIAEKFFGIWIIFFFVAVAYMIFPVSLSSMGLIVTRLLLWILGILVISTPFMVPLLVRKYLDQQLLENYYSALPKVYIVQIIFIVLTCIEHYILIRYFTGADINFYNVALAVSLVLIANLIPITYSGLGLREAASAWILPTLAGVNKEIAVGVSLIVFILNGVLPALPGLVLYLKKEKV